MNQQGMNQQGMKAHSNQGEKEIVKYHEKITKEATAR